MKKYKVVVIGILCVLSLGCSKKEELSPKDSDEYSYSSQSKPLDPENWYSPASGGELRALTNAEIIAAKDQCENAGMGYSLYSYNNGPTDRVQCSKDNYNEE